MKPKKICHECKQNKSLCSYQRHPYTEDGHRHLCIKCCRKKRNAEPPLSIAQQIKEYFENEVKT